MIPRYNISSAPGVLPVIYSVPLTSSQVPAATSAAFTSFANCKIDVLDKPFNGSFTPLAYVATGDTGQAVKSPLFKVT